MKICGEAAEALRSQGADRAFPHAEAEGKLIIDDKQHMVTARLVEPRGLNGELRKGLPDEAEQTTIYRGSSSRPRAHVINVLRGFELQQHRDSVPPSAHASHPIIGRLPCGQPHGSRQSAAF